MSLHITLDCFVRKQVLFGTTIALRSSPFNILVYHLDRTSLAVKTVLSVYLQFLPSLAIIHELIHLGRTKPSYNENYLSSGASYFFKLLAGEPAFSVFITK